VHRAGALNTEVACQLGIVGTAGLENALFPPDDAYYVLLKPSTCGQCSLAALANVHVTLVFTKPCALPVRIGAVKPFGTTCPVPDVSQPLFTPIDTTLSSADPGVQEFIIPVPADWKLVADAFVSVAFVAVTDSCSADADQPQLALREGCVPCTAFEDLSGSMADVCPNAAGLPLISADVAECVSTPVRSRSWGGVKILYR